MTASIDCCWLLIISRTGIYVEAEGYLKDVEVQARNDKTKAEVLLSTIFLFLV